MQNFIFALLLLTTAAPTYAEKPSAFDTRPHAEQLQSLQFENATVHDVVTEDGIVLKVAELLDENDQPMTEGESILLVHGYSSNWNSLKNIAELYRQKGYRVFLANWRGHGQGQFRSIGDTNPETDERMAYENLAAYDVPALVNFVLKESNGRPIIYQGHSMGGMMAHLAFAGVAKNANGELIIDKKRARLFEKQVKAFIPIASPLSLGSVKFTGMHLLEPLLNLIDLGNMDNSNGLALHLPFGSLVKHMRLSLTYAALRASKAVHGLINMNNITNSDFVEMYYLGGSKIPRIFSNQIMWMNFNGYTSRDGVFDFQAISQSRPTNVDYHRTKIPTLLLSPEDDVLAVVNEQKDLAKQRGIKYVEFKGVGHVDIVASPSLARRVALNTLGFAKQAGTTTAITSCEQALN